MIHICTWTRASLLSKRSLLLRKRMPCIYIYVYAYIYLYLSIYTHISTYFIYPDRSLLLRKMMIYLYLHISRTYMYAPARARVCVRRGLFCWGRGWRPSRWTTLSWRSVPRQNKRALTLHVEYAERGNEYGILFIFSLFYEYIHLQYVRIHVIYRFKFS